MVSGGYGFAIRELDDGRVIVVHVTAGGPAEAAGMQVGAVVTEFNGQPIADAIGEDAFRRAPVTADVVLMSLEHGKRMHEPLKAHL